MLGNRPIDTLKLTVMRIIERGQARGSHTSVTAQEAIAAVLKYCEDEANRNKALHMKRILDQGDDRLKAPMRSFYEGRRAEAGEFALALARYRSLMEAAA